MSKAKNRKMPGRKEIRKERRRVSKELKKATREFNEALGGLGSLGISFTDDGKK